MVLFVFAIIVALIAIVAVFVARAAGKRLATLGANSSAAEDAAVLRLGARIVVVVAALLAIVLGFFSSFTTVAANSVGIVTAFGHPPARSPRARTCSPPGTASRATARGSK